MKKLSPEDTMRLQKLAYGVDVFFREFGGVYFDIENGMSCAMMDTAMEDLSGDGLIRDRLMKDVDKHNAQLYCTAVALKQALRELEDELQKKLGGRLPADYVYPDED